MRRTWRCRGRHNGVAQTLRQVEFGKLLFAYGHQFLAQVLQCLVVLFAPCPAGLNFFFHWRNLRESWIDKLVS